MTQQNSNDLFRWPILVTHSAIFFIKLAFLYIVIKYLIEVVLRPCLCTRGQLPPPLVTPLPKYRRSDFDPTKFGGYLG